VERSGTPGTLGAQARGLDAYHARPRELQLLGRIDVAGAHEDDVRVGYGAKTGDGARERVPALPGEGGERRPVEKAARRRVGRIEVGMRIEPDDADG
jgi:hypothetical protein